MLLAIVRHLPSVDGVGALPRRSEAAGAQAGQDAAARRRGSDAATRRAAPAQVITFDPVTNLPSRITADAASPTATGTTLAARYASAASATRRRPMVSGSSQGAVGRKGSPSAESRLAYAGQHAGQVRPGTRAAPIAGGTSATARLGRRGSCAARSTRAISSAGGVPLRPPATS